MFREVNQVRNDLVVGISPEGCKFKAVASFSFLGAARVRFFYGIESGAVGVVLGIRAVGDNENLHILKQAAASPEGIPLIPLDLVERLTDCNPPGASIPYAPTAARSPVWSHHSGCHRRPPAFAILILVDDLHAVVVNVFTINQHDVLSHVIIALEDLHKVFLNLSRLLRDMIVRVGDAGAKEPLPFRI